MSWQLHVIACLVSLVTLSDVAQSVPQPERDLTTPTTMAIDQLLKDRWEKEEIKPAPLVADLEFLRRASLDIIGRPPTREEVREFSNDLDMKRRNRLINRLLASSDYANHWANVWTDWSMSHAGSTNLQRASVQAWFAKQWSAKPSVKEIAIQMVTAAGDPDENPLVHFVTAHRGLAFSENQWNTEGQYDMAPLGGRAMRLFMGSDVGCLQCHDHPFDPDTRQKDAWGVNLFFRQVKWEAVGSGAKRHEKLSDDPELHKGGQSSFERLNGKQVFAVPEFIDGKRIDKDDKRPRRVIFAEMLTKHERFPKAVVNRVWEQLVGRNLFEQQEGSIYSSFNECVYPELMDQLEKDFVLSNYDQRELIRWICQSEAYQREAVDRSADAREIPSFQRLVRKPLSPRQLFASLETVLDLKAALSDAERMDLRRRWEATLPAAAEYAHDHCSYPSEAVALDPTAYTRFLLCNSEALKKGARRPDHGVLLLSTQKGAPRKIVRELFERVYFREPTDAELKGIEQEFTASQKNRPRQDADLFWEDLLMAMLSAGDFTHNR